jgi:tetratricopeptide (TPR) repeat protein
VDTLNAIDDDRENIYTAWRWAVAHEEAEAISQSAEALSLYFMTRTARQIEAEPLFRQAKAGLDFKKFPTAWSRVAMRYVRLKRYGMFASTETFLEDIERCLANAEAEGDLHEIAICKKALALQGIADDRLKNEIAFERMREALSLWERTGRPYYVGNALKWLGNLAADHDIAMAYYEQSVAVAHEAGLHHHAAYTLIQIALTRLQQGRYQDAEAVYQEAISSFVALADRHLQTAAQASLCLAKFLQGQVVEARELFAEAVRIRQRYGLPDSEITEGMRLMLYSFDQDSGNQAPQLVGHVPAITPAVPFSQHVYSTGQLIQTYLTENSKTAWDAATERLRSAVEGDSLPFTIVALTIIAMLLADGGKLRRAVELLSLALNHPGSPRGLLESWSLLNKKHAELEVALGADAYAAAWDRGQTLDLDHVIEELIVEFDGEQAR